MTRDAGVGWRESLNTLKDQFEAKAASSRGLHHLFVEVGDHERHLSGGPAWFDADRQFTPDLRTNDPWRVVSFSHMPAVQPHFREFTAEDFGIIPADRVTRDGSGCPRAVFEPLRLRSSYLCGDHLIARPFKGLADTTARVLTGSAELAGHECATELAGLFGPPVGGVRYVFGSVADPPPQFVASGWDAGVLVYPDGVLIDSPAAGSEPDAGHWLLFLHRLGWRRTPGAVLTSERLAWHENESVPYEWVRDPDRVQLPADLRGRVTRMSPTAYYSVLGDQSSPLDVFLASSFAIQTLLAAKPAGSGSRSGSDTGRTPPARVRPDGPLPVPVSADFDEVREKVAPQVVIVTAVAVERDAVLRHMTPAHPRRSILRVFRGSNTYFVGRLGLQTVALCMSEMGSVGRDAAQTVTAEAIRDWRPVAAVMVGIAFGRDAERQRIGDVLVTDRVVDYETVRVGAESQIARGHQPAAGQMLLNRFRNAIGWRHPIDDRDAPRVFFGSVLSGQKLVDNADRKRELFEQHPHAIGGEMEGTGFAAAAERERCEWVLVKSICDWADGTKGNPTKDHDQQLAADTAVSLTRHVLNQPGVLQA